MERYIDKYNQTIEKSKITYVNKLKELHPMIYTLQVFTYHDYGEDNKIVACFTDEDNIKTLIGTGRWEFYCGVGSESYQFKIIPMSDYEHLDFNLLININNIDMSYYGKMI